MASLNDRITAGTVDEITTPAAGQRVAVSEDGDPGDKYIDVGEQLTALAAGKAAVSESSQLTLTDHGSSNMNGTIYLQRVGNIVTVMTDNVSHDPGSSINSDVGLIPSGYRPAENARTVYTAAVGIRRFSITTDGSINYFYTDYDGTSATETSSGTGACISYITTDAFPT